jgi:hypothetical protein
MLALTADQSGQVIQALFVPTVQRILTLVSHLVNMSQNGDSVVLIYAAALNATMRDLKWEYAASEGAERFLLLAMSWLRGYADHLNAYLLTLTEYEARSRRGPFPALTDFGEDQMKAIYDRIDQQYRETSAAREMNTAQEVVRDALLLVIDETGLPGSGLDDTSATDDDVKAADAALLDIINGWTVEQCTAALQWAGQVHLRASDNDVTVPPRPAHIPAPKAQTL